MTPGRCRATTPSTPSPGRCGWRRPGAGGCSSSGSGSTSWPRSSSASSSSPSRSSSRCSSPRCCTRSSGCCAACPARGRCRPLLALLIGLGLLAGIGYFVTWQITTHSSQLGDQVTAFVDKIRDWLHTGPLHLKSSRPRQDHRQHHRDDQEQPEHADQRRDRHGAHGRRGPRRVPADPALDVLPAARRRPDLELDGAAVPARGPAAPRRRRPGRLAHARRLHARAVADRAVPRRVGDDRAVRAARAAGRRARRADLPRLVRPADRPDGHRRAVRRRRPARARRDGRRSWSGSRSSCWSSSRPTCCSR